MILLMAERAGGERPKGLRPIQIGGCAGCGAPRPKPVGAPDATVGFSAPDRWLR